MLPPQPHAAPRLSRTVSNIAQGTIRLSSRSHTTCRSTTGSTGTTLVPVVVLVVLDLDLASAIDTVVLAS